MKKLTAIGFVAAFIFGFGSAMADCGCPPAPPVPQCPCYTKSCPTECVNGPCGTVLCCPKIEGILQTRKCCGCGI